MTGLDFSSGHLGFLANTAYAQALCRLAHEWSNWVTCPSRKATSLFLRDYSRTPMDVRAGESVYANDARFETLLQSLKDSSAAYFQKILFHTGRDGRMDEQFSRYNGYMRGSSRFELEPRQLSARFMGNAKILCQSLFKFFAQFLNGLS